MNLLYQSIYPATLLPWTIMCLFHLFKGSFCNFLILALHIFVQSVVMLHLPGLELTMVEWNRLLHAQRLCLIFIYGLRNLFHSPIIFLTLSLACIPCYRIKKIKSVTIHTTLLMAYASTSSIFGILIAGITGALYTKMNEVVLHCRMNDTLELYFNHRIGYTYLLCILEWTTSEMSYISLPLMIVVCFVFNVIIFLQTPLESDNRQDAWFNSKAIPRDYPYPLNINNAILKCNVAKKVFKPHEL
jgi:hypothetical protein